VRQHTDLRRVEQQLVHAGLRQLADQGIELGIAARGQCFRGGFVQIDGNVGVSQKRLDGSVVRAVRQEASAVDGDVRVRLELLAGSGQFGNLGVGESNRRPVQNASQHKVERDRDRCVVAVADADGERQRELVKHQAVDRPVIGQELVLPVAGVEVEGAVQRAQRTVVAVQHGGGLGTRDREGERVSFQVRHRQLTDHRLNPYARVGGIVDGGDCGGGADGRRLVLGRGVG
jgi:hypothetical protein